MPNCQQGLLAIARKVSMREDYEQQIHLRNRRAVICIRHRDPGCVRAWDRGSAFGHASDEMAWRQPTCQRSLDDMKCNCKGPHGRIIVHDTFLIVVEVRTWWFGQQKVLDSARKVSNRGDLQKTFQKSGIDIGHQLLQGQRRLHSASRSLTRDNVDVYRESLGKSDEII